MDFEEDGPALCPFCGGVKPKKRGIPPECPCTCMDCTDGCEIE